MHVRALLQCMCVCVWGGGHSRLVTAETVSPLLLTRHPPYYDQPQCCFHLQGEGTVRPRPARRRRDTSLALQRTLNICDSHLFTNFPTEWIQVCLLFGCEHPNSMYTCTYIILCMKSVWVFSVTYIGVPFRLRCTR